MFTRKYNVHHPPVFFGDTIDPVEEVYSHCHLGLTLQSNCTWSDHIQNIYKKACERLNMLRMFKYKMDRSSLIQIYLSFIRPVLEYGDVVWDNCSQQNSDLLESVQIEAARIITGLRRNSSKSNLYTELGIEPLSERRQKHKLILF